LHNILTWLVVERMRELKMSGVSIYLSSYLSIYVAYICISLCISITSFARESGQIGQIRTLSIFPDLNSGMGLFEGFGCLVGQEVV